jgi:hypothetical protein
LSYPQTQRQSAVASASVLASRKSKPTPKGIRSALYRITLTLALLAAQQAAALHDLSHGLENIARTSGTQEPPRHVYERCLAFF